MNPTASPAIVLKRTDGTIVDVPGLNLAIAQAIAPCLGKGWCFVTTRTAVVEEKIGAEAPKAPRVEKEPPLPDEAVIRDVTGLFADGKGRSKRAAKEALSNYGVDTVDGCIDWMRHTGRLTLTGKTYQRAEQP
jgi:hypothetical protein